MRCTLCTAQRTKAAQWPSCCACCLMWCIIWHDWGQGEPTCTNIQTHQGRSCSRVAGCSYIHQRCSKERDSHATVASKNVHLLEVLVCRLLLCGGRDVAEVHALRVSRRVAALAPPQVLVHVLRQERRERRHHLWRRGRQAFALQMRYSPNSDDISVNASLTAHQQLTHHVMNVADKHTQHAGGGLCRHRWNKQRVC